MTNNHKADHKPEEIQPEKTKRFLIILAALIFFTIAGGMYVRSKDNSENSALSPTPSFFSQNAANKIPRDWSLPTATSCQVAIPLPPQTIPYYFPLDPKSTDLQTSENGSGRYWHYEEKQQEGVFLFQNTVRAIFRNDFEGNNYISAEVEVLCAPNKFHLTTDQLLTEIQQILSVEQASDAVRIMDTKNKTQWNRAVNVVNFTNRTFNAQDDYYIFSVKNYIYMVSQKIKSSDKSVRQTAQKIFDNLQFPAE